MNMNLTKRKKSVILAYTIATIVFVILSLTIPFSKPAASWMMFAFSVVSLAGGCGITLFAFSKSEELKSKFYGYPVFRIGFLYTILQLALTLLIYIIGAFVSVPYWVGLAISVLLMGLASIGVITTDTARDYVEEIDTKTTATVKTLTRFNVDISDLVDVCKCDSAKIPLKKLAEKFKYSDQVSSSATEEKETLIMEELNNLREIITSNDAEKIIEQVEVVSSLLNSRNRICESTKSTNR